MSKALEATIEILGIEGDEAKHQTVGRLIVRLAREDASLDAAELRDKALAALGGVAYLAIAQAPPPSKPPQAEDGRRVGATSGPRQVHGWI
jgi:hypothetical protein